MTTTVKGMRVENLKNGAHHEFIVTALGIVQKHAKFQAQAAGAASTLALAQAKDAEDDKYAVATKSLNTSRIAEADSLRDQKYADFRNAVKALRAMPVPAMKDAAELIWVKAIGAHKVDVRSSLQNESGQLRNLLESLDEDYSTELATLGLTPLVDELRTANNEVISLMANRRIEMQGVETGALKAARDASDNAYRNVVRKVNACVELLGEDDFSSLVKQLNDLIDEYSRQLPKGKKSSEEEREDNPE